MKQVVGWMSPSWMLIWKSENSSVDAQVMRILPADVGFRASTQHPETLVLLGLIFTHPLIFLIIAPQLTE